MWTALVSTWRRDGALRVVLGLHLLLVALPALAAVVGRSVGWPSLAIAALAVTLAAVAAAERRTSGAERAFWAYLGAGLAFWLLAEAVRAVGEAPGWDLRARLGADSLRVAFALSLVFAVERRADRSAEEAPSEDHRLTLLGAVLFVFALLLYFVHIPGFFAPAEYATGLPSAFLAVALDLFLALRLGVLLRATHGERWRAIYGLLLLAVATTGLADLCGYWRLAWPLPLWGDAVGPWTALWVARALPLAVAARVAGGLAEQARGEAVERVGLGPLTLYALAVPVVHLALYPLTRAVSPSEGAREALTLGYAIVLGTLALAQLAVRERRRERAERALAESEERYRQVVEGSPDAILVENDRGLVFVNAAGRELLRPRAHGERTALADLGLEPPPLDETLPSTPARREVEVAGRGPLSLEVSYQRIAFAGAPAWQVIATDVTALEALRRKTAGLKRLAELGELAGTLADELRRPLGRLESRCRALAERRRAEDPHTAADLTLALGRLGRIADGIAELSRRQPPRLADEDLHDLIAEAIRAQAGAFSTDGIAVEARLEARDPRVRVDRGQILQVLANVLENARRAMPDGGVVEVATADRGETLEVRVRDGGVGIEAQHLGRLFDPFFTTRRDGTGLGLAIVARILAQHGSEPAVESRPGAGTTFRFALARGRG